MQIFSSIGGAPYSKTGIKVIRLIRKGCTNRPFFHISVMEKLKETYEPVIEQIGNYDPLPNKYNEKLVAINFKRLDHWLREGVELTTPVLKLLGLGGYFPIHPESFVEAWNNRKKISQQLEELRITSADFSTKEALTSKESTLASTGTVLASSVESHSETTESISDEPETQTLSSDPAGSTSISKKPFSSESSPTTDSLPTSDGKS